MTHILELASDATSSWAAIAAGLEPSSPILYQLSPAERVVVHFLVQGFSNREIARTLCKSEATVKNQVSACLHKCGVATRGRLIALLAVDLRHGPQI